MPSSRDSCWRQTTLPPSAVPYSLDETPGPYPGTTAMMLQWADGCSTNYLLPDEVRDFYEPGVAREQQIRKMMEQHDACHARASVRGKLWVPVQTIGQPDAWFCPETGEREEIVGGETAPLHSPLCGTAHGAGTCPLCDVLTAKERSAGMTGVQNHTLVVPERVAEWERRHRMAQDLKSAAPREEAAAPTQPPARRYCPREG